MQSRHFSKAIYFSISAKTVSVVKERVNDAFYRDYGNHSCFNEIMSYFWITAQTSIKIVPIQNQLIAASYFRITETFTSISILHLEITFICNLRYPDLVDAAHLYNNTSLFFSSYCTSNNFSNVCTSIHFSQ